MIEQEIIRDCIQKTGPSDLQSMQSKLPFQSLKNIVKVRNELKNQSIVGRDCPLPSDLPSLNLKYITHHFVLVCSQKVNKDKFVLKKKKK